jgi:hypothetical protein
VSRRTTTQPETKPRRNYHNRRFYAPRGGDTEPRCGHVVEYHNPSLIVAKQQRMKRVTARLFGECGLAAVGLDQASQAANLPAGDVEVLIT